MHAFHFLGLFLILNSAINKRIIITNISTQLGFLWIYHRAKNQFLKAL